MGTRTTRNRATQRSSALGSVVSPANSELFLRTLAASMQEALLQGPTPFAPGQFFPTETSILTPRPPGAESPVEHVQELVPEREIPDEAFAEVPDSAPATLFARRLAGYEALLELARETCYAPIATTKAMERIGKCLESKVESASSVLHHLKQLGLCLEADPVQGEPDRIVIVFRPYQRSANGLVVIPHECESPSADQVEESPEDDERSPGDIIDLAVAREIREDESAGEAREIPSEEEDGIDPEEEPSEDFLEQLFQFARQAAEQSLGTGIRDLDLRRSAGSFPSDDALIQAIQRRDLAEAKRLVLERHLTLVSVMEMADKRLESQTQSKPTGGMSPVDGVIYQLKVQLDKVLTASAQRMPSELHSVSIEAGTQCRIHEEAARGFEEARGRLLPLVRQITTAVAELGMAYEHRQDLRIHVQLLEDLFRESDALRSRLTETHAQCQEAEERLRGVMDESHHLRMRAKALVEHLRQLTGSARLLGAEIPAEISSQVNKTTSAIETLLTESQGHMMDLITPDWDAKIERSLGSIDRDRARAAHMVNPIRPSVFRRRMDRMEELRRLTLIAYHILTFGRVHRKKKGEDPQPHRGYGKKTIPHEIMVLSNLIDESEAEVCEQMLLRFNHHSEIEKQVRARLHAEGHTRIRKDLLEAAMDQECGPILVVNEQVGRGWVYRPNEEGHQQAQAWLVECVEPQHVRTRFENALRAYHKRKFAERRQTDE